MISFLSKPIPIQHAICTVSCLTTGFTSCIPYHGNQHIITSNVLVFHVTSVMPPFLPWIATERSNSVNWAIQELCYTKTTQHFTNKGIRGINIIPFQHCKGLLDLFLTGLSVSLSITLTLVDRERRECNIEMKNRSPVSLKSVCELIPVMVCLRARRLQRGILIMLPPHRSTKLIIKIWIKQNIKPELPSSPVIS